MSNEPNTKTEHRVLVVNTSEPFQRSQTYQAQCDDCGWAGKDRGGDDAKRNATDDAHDHTRGDIEIDD